MSKLNLGPVKAFNVMKTCFGGFEDVGASKVEFKNYKRYSMVFVPFTGIDNHHCNVTFGAALLASETADTYIWLLRVFLKVVGSQPKVVVTDQYPAMKKAISALFVDTRHRLCMWHVMHKLSLKVGVWLCNSTNFKERICGVVWTDILTPEEFESEWEMVIAEFNLEDDDWLSDIFALRESWIPAYYRMEPVTAELIGVADCINQRYEGQLDGFVKFYVNDFKQLCTSLFEVLFRKSDCTCSCSCRRFEQIGLLCRHIFYVLRLMDIREFPKQYILNRWRKEPSPNCPLEFSISREYMTELDPDVKSMMRDVIYSTEYTLNRLSGNIEELSLYKDHVQSYMKKVQDMQIVTPPASSRDIFAEITGQYKNDKNPIRVPVDYKSKGSGSRKRLKSKQEIVIDKKKSKSKPVAKERQCQYCIAYGFYASTCKQAVIKRRSTRTHSDGLLRDTVE
ncbi:protein FAR1-RELATED SEQUENCE 2-like [Helianthus annuus]|nr:protein FAR1-RELATED SEQUENCE 2-like [Helianthus annuus]